jgi:hypothetical protein
MDRLRWDNIARAAAVVAVIALVVAWPRLKGAPPSLPPAAAKPVSIEDPALPAVPEQPAREPKPRRRAKPQHRRIKPRQRASRRRREPARSAPAPAPHAVAPVVPQAEPPAPQPPPAPSASDLAAHEFAVP